MDLLDADGHMKKGKGKRAQIMQLDVWTISTGVIMPGLSDYTINYVWNKLSTDCVHAR